MWPASWNGHCEVDAARVALTLGSDQRALSRARAGGGELPRRQPVGPFGQHRADHLGDDVAGPPHDHGVAGADVLDRDLVLVVQGGLADVGAADEDRFELGEGRGPAGAAHRHLDVEQLGGPLLGRELVGDGPARRPAGEAKLVTPGQVVDLDHHPVDLVVEVVAVVLPPQAEPVHLGEVGHDRDLRVDREPEVAQEVEGLGVGGERRPTLDLAQLVAPHGSSRPAVIDGSFWRKRPRRGVAGVDEQPLACLGLARRFKASKAVPLMYTSPRTSSTLGAPSGSRLGITPMVADVGGDVLAVTPSPRVAACTRRPPS